MNGEQLSMQLLWEVMLLPDCHLIWIALQELGHGQ
jgi:hypothetical protein